MGMMSDQTILFCLLGVVFGLLVWGKMRYDLVAFGALIVAVVIGVVPQEEAFSGFGHHATIIIALVLIVSRGLSNSGAIELVARYLIVGGRSLFMHIGVMSGVAALLSAVMNNVAALSLLMPIDMQAAKKAKRSAALDADATVLRVDTGRYDYADRYAAEYHHRQLSRAGAGRTLRHVRFYAGGCGYRARRNRLYRGYRMAPGAARRQRRWR